MIFSDYKFLEFSREGTVLTATMNRPDVRNAVNAELDDDLSRLFWDVDRDPETRVLVLTGAGTAFSAGGDIEHMRNSAADINYFERGARNGKRLLYSILDCEKPVISRINGDAVGLGATIALFADISIAVETARIGDPHVRVGLVAGDGGAVIWPQLVGYARAKQYLLSGDLMTGKEAEAIGLINFAVSAEELDAKVNEWSSKFANGAFKAIRYTKATINIGLKQLLASMSDAGFALETVTSRSEDHQEAVAAFMEKRKPIMTGN